MTVSLQKEKWTVQNSVRLLEIDAQKKFNISSIKENDLFLFCVEFVFMLFQNGSSILFQNIEDSAMLKNMFKLLLIGSQMQDSVATVES